MKIAVYPGSFDPCTNGHIDVIRRAAAIFDKVIVAVTKNSSKKYAFSEQERVDFLKRSTAELDNVEIDCCKGLLADYMREKNAGVIIKGLRTNTDFEYEFQQAHVNHQLNNEIETLFMVTNLKNVCLSSSIVRELVLHGGSITGMVPSCIEDDIVKKLK